jgi:hypothetical protein
VSCSVDVADATNPVRILKRVTDDAFVSDLHVVHPLNAAVAANAVLNVVKICQEPSVDQDLFPCLQRRQLSRSALAGGFLRLYLLFFFDGQILQACLIGMAGHTVAGCDLRRRCFSHGLGRGLGDW